MAAKKKSAARATPKSAPRKRAERAKPAPPAKGAKGGRGGAAAAVAKAPAIVEPPPGPEKFEHLAPGQIVASATNPRRHFDKAAQAELEASVRVHGVLQPVLVRPKGKGYELVAGERRWRAATTVKAAKIPAIIRTLTDSQVLEIQVIENLQRQDLHPLEEAEGYEALLKARPDLDVQDIADKVGKSKGYVYARMKLCALGKEGRKAFYDEKLSPSVALLIARVPAQLQGEALKAVLEGDMRDDPDQPPTFVEASRIIHEDFMLRLDQAPFPTADAELVPKAGSCAACPKRTGNEPLLFSEVKSKDVCTDPVCFRSKVDALFERTKAEAEASGRKVLSDAEAKKVFPHANSHSRGGISVAHGSGYVDLVDDHPADRDYYGGTRRTWQKLLGKSAEQIVVLAKDPEGKVRQLIKQSEAAALLRKKGVKVERPKAVSSTNARWKREEAKRREKSRRERLEARAVHTAALSALSKPDGMRPALAILAANKVLDQYQGHEARAEARGLEFAAKPDRKVEIGYSSSPKAAAAKLALLDWIEGSATETELVSLLVEGLTPQGGEIPKPYVIALGARLLELPPPLLAERVKALEEEDKTAKRARRGGASPKGAAGPGTCRECGCTDTTPCLTEGMPCSWVDEEETLCTACATKAEEAEGAAALAARSGKRRGRAHDEEE